MNLRQALGATLAAGLAVGWAWAAHRGTVLAMQAPWSALVAAASVAGMIVWVVAALAGRTAAIASVPALVLAGWFAWPTVVARLPELYLAQHVGILGGLAWLFGGTLRAYREPLVAGFARRIHGPLPPAMARYARQVTVAWTVFFVAMAMLSGVLFAFAPLAAWSWFANLLTWPLVAVMFVGEYLVRRWRLPQFEHATLLEGARAFWRTWSP